MGSQFDEIRETNAELREKDPNGTMTQNPGGNRRATRETVFDYLRKRDGEKVITDPTTGKKAGKAAALQAVQKEIESHNDGGMEL